MDFSVSPTRIVENAAAALEELAHGVEGQPSAGPDAIPAAGPTAATAHADATQMLAQGGFVERVLGEVSTAMAAVPAQAPGERADKTVETNTAQTFARPQFTQADQPRHVDATPTQAHHGHGDFALLQAQLVPTALIGLQVDHPTLWPMTTRGFDADLAPAHQARVEERDAHTAAWEGFYEEDDTSFDDEAPQGGEHDAAPPPVVEVVAEPDEAWCAPLNRALRLALSARVPPRALVAADEQWRRGRCVVLACPQGTDPSAGAWAFVLLPCHPQGETEPHAITVRGTRVDARLQWSRPPAPGTWLHARVMKQHHPRTGRQLVPATTEPAVRVPCEVQLGPVLARVLRPCDVCLKVGAVRRLWNALGSQWSMYVVVSATPLVNDDAIHAGNEEIAR